MIRLDQLYIEIKVLLSTSFELTKDWQNKSNNGHKHIISRY